MYLRQRVKDLERQAQNELPETVLIWLPYNGREPYPGRWGIRFVTATSSSMSRSRTRRRPLREPGIQATEPIIERPTSHTFRNPRMRGAATGHRPGRVEFRKPA